MEKFIQLIEMYGKANVLGAIKETARLAKNNPKKNIGYVIEVLRAWEKEGKLLKNPPPPLFGTF